METNGELVAVAEAIPIASAMIPEACAVAVIIPIASIERMEIAERIAAAAHFDSDIDVRYAHVAQRVVISFHQHADGIPRTVAHDVHAHDVRIRRTTICTMFDMDANARMLDRYVADFRFASTVNGNSVGDAISINDSARETIIAADGAKPKPAMLSAYQEQ